MTDDPGNTYDEFGIPVPGERSEASAAWALMNPAAVRTRCQDVMSALQHSDCHGVALDMNRLDLAAQRVADIVRAHWPDLALPFNSVWRRFEAGGHDRFAGLAAIRQWPDVRDMGRTAFDMALVAGYLGLSPGAAWSYDEEMTGERYDDAEGLAVASMAMTASGLFSGVPSDPLRADAGQLARLSREEIAAGLRIAPDNQIREIDARVRRLTRLGEATNLRDDLFARADDPRPGGLFDVLFEEGLGAPVSAQRIFEALADGLGPIFAGGRELGNIALGDTGSLSALPGCDDSRDDATAGLVPFHTRLQRLVCDLAEPLVWSGVEIRGLESLTGSADARIASLFLDMDILMLEAGNSAIPDLTLNDPTSVTLRAASLALLDRLADLIRDSLGREAAHMPLAGQLEGAIRRAGSEIALEKRGTHAPALRFAGAGAIL